MIGLFLGACGRGLDHQRPLTVVRVERGAHGVQVLLRFHPDRRVVQALEAQIALPFRVEWYAADGRRLGQRVVVLKHLPLLDRYLVQDGERERRFRLRGEALTAFESLALVAPEPIEAVRVRIDLDRLPPALRLPAALDAAWRLDTGRHSIAEAH